MLIRSKNNHWRDLKYFPTNRWLDFKCYTDDLDKYKYGEMYVEVKADKHKIHCVKYRNVCERN